MMKLPSELSYADLLDVVRRVQRILYLESNDHGIERWNADKQWSAETLEQVAGCLARYGLVPEADV